MRDISNIVCWQFAPPCRINIIPHQLSPELHESFLSAPQDFGYFERLYIRANYQLYRYQYLFEYHSLHFNCFLKMLRFVSIDCFLSHSQHKINGLYLLSDLLGIVVREFDGRSIGLIIKHPHLSPWGKIIYSNDNRPKPSIAHKSRRSQRTAAWRTYSAAHRWWFYTK